VLPRWPLSRPADWRRDPAGETIDPAIFTIVENGAIPSGVVIVKGERAGVRSHAEGSGAGPTGVPWVDSNGWRIRLARLQNPGKTIWVETEAPKPNEVVGIEQYLVGIAGAGAHGGRWVLAPDPHWSQAVAAGDSSAVRNWARAWAAAKFFEQHEEWAAMPSNWTACAPTKGEPTERRSTKSR
jgi:hypothetical protein